MEAAQGENQRKRSSEKEKGWVLSKRDQHQQQSEVNKE